MTGHLRNDEENLKSKALGRHTQIFPPIKWAKTFQFQWCVGKVYIFFPIIMILVIYIIAVW